jgi:DNA-3-methyladenine glycosylase II
MTTPSVPHYWSQACRALSRRDPVLKGLIKQYKDVRLKSRGTAFETLLRAIVGQQISVKAAQAVWAKFEKQVGGVSVARVLTQTPQQLRSCGLSRQKTEYILDLAQHFETKQINPRSFRSMGDDDLIARLCEVRGIGQWTAEMFLIFQLQRADIYPLQDIGLIRAVEKHYLDGQEAEKSQIIAIGEAWKPWRTVATWYLWRSLDPFPVEY